jgi:hypothetical protein
LVASEIDPVVDDLCAVLGVAVSFRDPGVEIFGLRNAVMPIGDTFLEVVSPIREDATAMRYLRRRGGDGGYMVMVQSDDLDADCERLERLGVRVVWGIDLDDIRGRHLHPRDVGAAILSLDAPLPPSAWRWAGPEWPEMIHTGVVEEITAVEIQSEEPSSTAARWAAVLGREARPAADGVRIDLERGAIRFVDAIDGRGAGVGAFDVAARDEGKLLATARARGLQVAEDHFVACGVRIYPRHSARPAQGAAARRA